MVDILMPALSPTMTEGKLAKWLKQPGDEIKSGDVIAEIETDKATMEVEAVDEGKLEEILVPEGTEGVAVNTVIARMGGENAPAAQPDPPAPAPAPATPATPAAVHKTVTEIPEAGWGETRPMTVREALREAMVLEMRAEHDSLDHAKARLIELGMDEAALKKIDDGVKARVQEAADFAQSSPEPEPGELYTDVLVEG